MKYELWKHEEDRAISYGLIPVDENYASQREFIDTYEPGSELILTIQAADWDEATEKRDVFLGWKTHSLQSEK